MTMALESSGHLSLTRGLKSNQGAARRTQVRSTITREKLIAAARPVFAKKGYAATEITDLIDLVGVTKGALYHHFGGKSRLFDSCCIQIAHEIHEHSSKIVMQYSGDAWTQLILSIKSRFEIIASSYEAQRLLLIDGPSILGWRRWREIQADVSLGPLERTLEVLIEQGRIPDQPTAPIAQLLLAALNDAALSVATSSEPVEESAKLIVGLKTLINGLCTPAQLDLPCAMNDS